MPIASRALRRPVRRLLAVAALVASMAAAAVVTDAPMSDRAFASSHLGAGGEYHPLPPTRVLDTRSGINDVVKPGVKRLSVDTNSANLFDVQILGQGGLPSDPGQVMAVVANVTVVAPSHDGFLRAWGTGAAEGGSSIVNFRPGQVVPNMAILRPGDNGKVSVRLVSGGPVGTAHVLIDVFGWFSTNAHAEQGARLIPAGPGRIHDTRVTGNSMTAGEVLTLPIRGADATGPNVTDIVPNDPNVVGVLVNVTGVNARPGSRATHVSVVPEMPAGGAEPATSNLNLRQGQVKANLVLVPIGGDGAIRLFNKAGDTDLVVDVVAYLVDGRPVETRAGRVVPLASPFRVLDTRLPAFGGAPLGPAYGEDWSFASFVADVKIGNEPVGAQSALLGNLTATDLRRQPGWYDSIATHLTVYPTPAGGAAGPPPNVSNLNIGEGESVPNMALLRYGGGSTDPYQVRFYNRNGLVHYLLDVSAVVLTD